MKKLPYCLIIVLIIIVPCFSQTTEVQYLSGKGIDDAVQWDFFCTDGRKSGSWQKIPVPSVWEQHGFGSYNYGHDRSKNNEQGTYRYTFNTPSTWSGKQVFIVFEGSMTDTDVKVNGKSAGPKHQGSFYCFKYDITSLLNFGADNTLEVTVSKMSSNASINAAERKADYWVFGGIFRPVYLEAYPKTFIRRIASDPKASGAISVNVYIQGLSGSGSVTARVKQLNGVNVGSELTGSISGGKEEVRLSGSVSGIKPWSAETPNLYLLEVTLNTGGSPVHITTERIGFRTVEVKAGDGVYINGAKMMFKGVNRHCFWPASGRALSPRLSLNDVNLLKSMNMNAVRNSHYPADKHFMDYCDSLGLYMLDELAGWQKPPYDIQIAEKLVEEMVSFNVNHPCIIFWNNANEGGWNTAVDDDYAKWDPQGRKVLHPWATFSGINTDHYETYSSIKDILSKGTIYMPTEFLHGLYDGGHGAGLDDYWNLMRSQPLSAGGFLWVFADEGIERTDRNNTIDVAGNYAPDGIVGPYHEKEGSFYTIREIWSPIYCEMETLPADFSGTIKVENRYDFLNLNTCTFSWVLADFGFAPQDSGYRVAGSGKADVPSIASQTSGNITLNLPLKWRNHDALLLDVTDLNGCLIYKRSWMIKSPSKKRREIVDTVSETAASVSDNKCGNGYIVTAGEFEYTINKKTGFLSQVTRAGKQYSLSDGPLFSSGSAFNKSIKTSHQGNDVIIEATYPGNLRSVIWRFFGNGWLHLQYEYVLDGSYDYFGVNFKYPVSKVTGAQWLGKGPHRVWRNRLKGTWHDVWQRKKNNGTPGAIWEFPEFKGFFSDLYWARLFTSEGTIQFVMDSPDIFMQLFTPPNGPRPKNERALLPDNKGLSFMHGISAVGTKFHAFNKLGPQSQRYSLNNKTFKGSMYIGFGDMALLPTVVMPEKKKSDRESQKASMHYVSKNCFNLVIPGNCHVSAALFDLKGRRVAGIYNGHLKKGIHSIRKNINAQGLFIYRLSVNGEQRIKSKIFILE